MTDFFFRMLCRGLFHKHRLTFAFLIAAIIGRENNGIGASEWSFLLRGALQPVEQSADAAPASDVITASIWKAACELAAGVPVFGDLPRSVHANLPHWEAYATCQEPWTAAACAAIGTSTAYTEFQRLLLVQCFQPDKLLEGIQVRSQLPILLLVGNCDSGRGNRSPVKWSWQSSSRNYLCRQHGALRADDAVQAYVSSQLGPAFVSSSAASVADVFADSSNSTPIIFIGVAGVDASAPLKAYMDGLGASAENRLVAISLGQGQGAVAEAAIEAAAMNGTWVRSTCIISSLLIGYLWLSA